MTTYQIYVNVDIKIASNFLQTLFLSGHERLTDDLDFGKNSSFFEPEPLVPKSCPHQTSIHNELLKEHEMISRLTNSLFALKIGTFRDLMVGSQMISGLGVGHG